MIALSAAAPDTTERHWQRAILRLAAVQLALLALFAGDVADLLTVWTNDKTYNHCLLVGPIVAVLVWLRRRELAALEPGIWSLPLLWIGGAALAWLLGELAGVGQVRQLALVAMIQGAVAVCLGRQVTRGLLFPLAYLFFLVPFGAELVPPLQQLTAVLSTGLLHLTGIPAQLDGVFITTPAGWFEVAEACSGISFLIATIAWGVLVANLLFTSIERRVAFVTACVVLPIFANGLRAWATVAAAEWVGVERASGFDHIVYGWIFFALVLMLLMAAGWRWFERSVDDPAFDPIRLQSIAPGAAGGGTVVLAVALPAAAFLWAGVALGWGERPMTTPINVPQVAGWTRVAADPSTPPWTPHYDGADHTLIGSYRDGSGRTVELAIALFRSQAEGREITGFGQGAIAPDSEWAWTAALPAPSGASGVRMLGPHRAARSAWTFNVVDGEARGGALPVKTAVLATRLRLGDPAAGALIVSAAGGEPEASAAMADFLTALGPPDRMVERLIADARTR